MPSGRWRREIAIGGREGTRVGHEQFSLYPGGCALTAKFRCFAAVRAGKQTTIDDFGGKKNEIQGSDRRREAAGSAQSN